MNSRFVRWTDRGGETWDAGAWNGVGVEDLTGIAKGDGERLKWGLKQF